MDLMMRRREMLKIAGGSAPSINDYVTNGIILWYDGIQNTPNGHDSTSQYWYDLSGNDVHYAYSSSNIISSKYCDIDGTAGQWVSSASSNVSDNINGHVAFVEIVIDPDETGETTQCLFPYGNVVGTTWIKTNAIGFQGNSNSKSLSLSSGVHYYNSELYKDGTIQTNANVSSSWSTAYFTLSGARRIFSYSNATNYAAKCNIYAFRVYNRVLTASEIQKNWLTDKARFGI